MTLLAPAGLVESTDPGGLILMVDAERDDAPVRERVLKFSRHGEVDSTAEAPIRAA